MIDFASAAADLADGSLMRLAEGERLWKLFFLAPVQGQDSGIEHRIFTKEQVDGAVTLISYSVHRAAAPDEARSDVAIARDIPKDTLNQLVWKVVKAAAISPEELEVVDLSPWPTFEEQLEHLAQMESDRS